ncbi:MAG TPA: acyl-ACP thioesterase domain-containing protein [Ktedonobacteraceae bacterium]|nr:acyl-ACP thioesterase domain-containing protein [Ktedonobacteraceae bacterium]
MKRQFRYHYTVRYDEGDCYGLMKPSTFLRYMQDIASLDAEDAQLGGDGFWVVKRTVVSFTAPVPVHTSLEVKTYGLGFTRITAQRAYDAHIVGQEQSRPVVAARSLWVYVDTRGRPTRLPERTAQIWLPDGPEPQIPDAPWPEFPQRAPERVNYTVRFSDTDLMKHINNATYIEVLDNAAWEAYAKAGITPDNAEMHVLSYEIEYLESARLGEQLEIHTWLEPVPGPGQQFTRLQQVMRNGTLLVKVRSRWQWHV